MSRRAQEMWASLLKAGLIEGAAPETEELGSPWYVKVLLGFSGWLAAIFLLGFIGLGFKIVIKNSILSFAIGAIMIGGAFAILRIPKNEFVEHLALAVSLAGQALVVFAIFDILNRNEKVAWLLVVLLQVPLAILMPNFVHQVFSSFFAAFAFNMSMTFWHWPYVVSGAVMLLAALCWLNEFHYPSQIRKMQAIGYGFVLALIQIKGTALFGNRIMWWRFTQHQQSLWTKPWMGEVLTGVVTLYVVWHLLRRYGQRISDRISIIALSGTVLLCVASMKVQGITVGMVIMLLGYAGANRILLGLGIVSLLFYISSYYYLLDAMLLSKSLTLLIVGMVLLSLRWLLLHIMPVEKEANHA
jgi:uncharacterized membrane protein